MNREEIVKVNKLKKLIDLNGDKTNFDLKFNVESLDNSEFEALVVSQSQLDSGESLNYKKAPGKISGNIVADKNVYQNYFLLLKSDNEIECKIEILIKDIPPKIDIDLNQQFDNFVNTNRDTSIINENQNRSDFKKKLLIIFIIIGVGLLIWFLIKPKISTKKTESISDIVPDNINSIEIQNNIPETEVNTSIYIPEIEGVNENLNTKFDNKLFTRLNNIKIW